MAANNETLVTLTADIVAAHVTNNSVAVNDISALIENIFGALQGLDAPLQDAEAEKPKGAVSIRASIKPDYLISMIDGKQYKMLRRHLTLQGYTPESYRAAFGLPIDYPMVAATYAEKRRALAHKIGLGKKRTLQEPLKAARKSPTKKVTPIES